MEEEVGFGLTRSHLTAIPRFVFSDFIVLKQNAPASARSRNPRRSVCKTTVGLMILDTRFEYQNL